jgi:pyrroline-5-carboxylate reductase
LDSDTHILLIGFGNMGRALVSGWLARGCSREAVRVVDAAAPARQAAAELGLGAWETVGEASAASAGPFDVVLAAVKPNQLASALTPCRELAGQPVFLSIAAGKTIAQLLDVLGPVAAVRAMPNTPAAVGRGMTVLVANAAVSAAQRGLCGDLLAAVGEIAWLDDERHMDAVTAVSGSGPAYVFLLIECLEQAGVAVGLSASLARQLALATVAGAGAYASAAGEPAAELRRRVTSPGGTTQAALEVLLAEPGLKQLLERAVRAATERGRALSQA